MSEARRDGLRADEESAATFPEKAGLAGANILCLFILGVPEDFDWEEPAFALSKSFVKYKHPHTTSKKVACHFCASYRL